MNNTPSDHNTTDSPSCFYLDRFQVFQREPLRAHFIVNCTLNAVLSVTAILGNVMILNALRKSSVFRPPRALLFSLAMSDLAIGLVVQPLYVIYKVAELKGNHRVYCNAGTGFHLSANVFSAVSFLTVVAIAVDRLLALLLGVKYQTTVTLRRIVKVILCLWALTSLWVFTWLWSIRVYQVFNITVASVCLFVSLSKYARLWLQIRRLKVKTMHRLKIEGKEEVIATRDPKIGIYNRSVMNMFYIYVLLLVCYTPYLAMFIVFETSKISMAKIAAISYSITVLFANATLNPFLYCWRIREIRKEVLATISKFCPKW